MSKRFAAWTPASRSPTASSTTTGTNPCCMASSAVARTQPLVVRQAMKTVSMSWEVRHMDRGVPKKALGHCFATVNSPSVGPVPR